ncbi:hypothetical protein [Natrinema salinisoli]|uniref:hypothetical protein n=1 Tax=Natrinema salinisoli TaxID=2878535 RepID=UPI001CEFFB82|nr:hypothetical protein [Natrinema salinisoli]
MSNSYLSRRHLLGVVALPSLAGCTALGSGPGVRLGNIQIGNTEDEPVTFKLRIERDGSLIYQNRIEVSAGYLHDVERTWDSDPGAYSVFYTSSFGEGIHRLSIPADEGGGDGDCVDMRFYCWSDITDAIIYDEDKPEWSGC